MQLYELDTVPLSSPSSSSHTRVLLISFFLSENQRHYNTLPWKIRSQIRSPRSVRAKRQRNHRYTDVCLVKLVLTFRKGVLHDLPPQNAVAAGEYNQHATVSDLVIHALPSVTKHDSNALLDESPDVARLVVTRIKGVTTRDLIYAGSQNGARSASGLKSPSAVTYAGNKLARSPTIPLGPTCSRMTKRQTRSTRQRGMRRGLQQVEAEDHWL